MFLLLPMEKTDPRGELQIRKKCSRQLSGLSSGYGSAQYRRITRERAYVCEPPDRPHLFVLLDPVLGFGAQLFLRGLRSGL